jgi:hypothetical protein
MSTPGTERIRAKVDGNQMKHASPKHARVKNELTAALMAVGLLLGIAVAAAPQAVAATGIDFGADLLAACPHSDQPAPSDTGPAKACDWVPMDANGIAIDSANGNSAGVADPKWVTSFYQPDTAIAHASNCTAGDATSTLAETTTTGTSTTFTLGIENEISVKAWSIKIKTEYSTTTSSSVAVAVSASKTYPAYHDIEWDYSHYMTSVQGRIKVTLNKWVTDPTNPSGGTHHIWYPSFTLTQPATPPSTESSFDVTSKVTAMSAAEIAACSTTSQETVPLVNKYGTEHGGAPAGFCATVVPNEMLSQPCDSTDPTEGAPQQFVMVPMPVPNPLTNGGTRVLIVSTAANGCLGPASGTVGSAALMQPCDSTSLGQVWSQIPISQGSSVVNYVNAKTGLCLNAWAAQPAAKYGLNQAACSTTDSIYADTESWSTTAVPFPGRATAVVSVQANGSAPRFTSVPRTDALGSRHDLPSGDNMIVVDPGATFTYRVAVTGSPAPTVAVISQLPSWLTFSGGVLRGVIPSAIGAAMTVPVTFSATNAAGSAAQVAVVSITT